MTLKASARGRQNQSRASGLQLISFDASVQVRTRADRELLSLRLGITQGYTGVENLQRNFFTCPRIFASRLARHICALAGGG